MCGVRNKSLTPVIKALMCPNLKSAISQKTLVFKKQRKSNFWLKEILRFWFFSIRNTGMGFTSILAMIIGIAGPYVVHLGTVDVRYPYGIMASISLCGAIAVSF